MKGAEKVEVARRRVCYHQTTLNMNQCSVISREENGKRGELPKGRRADGSARQSRRRGYRTFATCGSSVQLPASCTHHTVEELPGGNGTGEGGDE